MYAFVMLDSYTSVLSRVAFVRYSDLLEIHTQVHNMKMMEKERRRQARRKKNKRVANESSRGRVLHRFSHTLLILSHSGLLAGISHAHSLPVTLSEIAEIKNLSRSPTCCMKTKLHEN